MVVTAYPSAASDNLVVNLVAKPDNVRDFFNSGWECNSRWLEIKPQIDLLKNSVPENTQKEAWIYVQG